VIYENFRRGFGVGGHLLDGILYVPPLLNIAGTVATLSPRPIRTAATARATKFAGGTSTWHQWATASVLAWSPQLPIAATAKKVGLATPGSLDSVFFQASGGTYGFSVIADCHNYSLQRRS